MRPVRIGGVSLLLEMAEGGTRYHAPIVILPGLFQSEACWRGITSMLAHRGWDVYILTRQSRNDDSSGRACSWEAAVDEVAAAARGLGEKLIVLGADVGASIALAVSGRAPALALGLFSPVEPHALGCNLLGSVGYLGRRRFRSGQGPVVPPRSLARLLAVSGHCAPEPRAFVEDLLRGVAFERPEAHPPAVLFAPADDPLVSQQQAMEFAQGPFVRTSSTRLAGRWWPGSGWEPVADAVHRFLILTLSDRVVEFPEEILAD